MEKPYKWSSELRGSDRTRASLVFMANVFRLDFFNDNVRDYDHKYKKDTFIIDSPYLDMVNEMVDFKSLRLTLNIIQLVTIFEAYLLDTVREILSMSPDALKTGRQLTYREVFSFNNLDELRTYAIDREVEQLGYGSYRQVSKYYNERFNIDFAKLTFRGRTNLDQEHIEELEQNGVLVDGAGGKTINQDVIVEVFATRNILVHNQGVINQAYLESVPNSPFKKEMVRPLSDEY